MIEEIRSVSSRLYSQTDFEILNEKFYEKVSGKARELLLLKSRSVLVDITKVSALVLEALEA